MLKGFEEFLKRIFFEDEDGDESVFSSPIPRIKGNPLLAPSPVSSCSLAAGACKFIIKGIMGD